MINDYADNYPKISKSLIRIKSGKVNAILNSIQVHMIREQRFSKVQSTPDRNFREEKEHLMIEAIQTYAKEKQVISNFRNNRLYRLRLR